MDTIKGSSNVIETSSITDGIFDSLAYFTGRGSRDWIIYLDYAQNTSYCSKTLLSFFYITNVNILWGEWLYFSGTLVYLQEVADAIKNLLLSIRSIITQQAEEDNILKRLEKLQRKLQRCSTSRDEMQKKIESNLEDDGDIANMSPKHPLHSKIAETEALKKQVESVKADYLDSVQYSRTMTLDNLKTRLPYLFLSLMEFSSASSQAIEAINSQSSQ